MNNYEKHRNNLRRGVRTDSPKVMPPPDAKTIARIDAALRDGATIGDLTRRFLGIATADFIRERRRALGVK